MINFQYDKIVIMRYEIGAGGKFLINSLSLNDNAVFQNNKLAKYQLNGNFNLKEKLKFLNHYLNVAHQTKKWNDLMLYEKDLFGITI